MRRVCCRCKEEKPIEEFNFKIKRLGIRQKACQECTRMELRNHYKNNRQYYITKAKRRNIKMIAEYHKYIGFYLSSHPCVDCGEKDILVLEFDHIDRKKKTFEIINIYRLGYSMRRLTDEISKCQIRCSNCHRRKTARENNNWKLSFAPVA